MESYQKIMPMSTSGAIGADESQRSPVAIVGSGGVLR